MSPATPPTDRVFSARLVQAVALTEAIGERDVSIGMMNMTGQLGAAAGITVLGSMVMSVLRASVYFGTLSTGAILALIAVAMGSAIRFTGPAQTRPTPASPIALCSAVVDPDRGRRRS